MGEPFIRIYDFFERRRALLWLTLALSVCAMSFFAVKIRYNEQITSFFQSDDQGRQQAMVFDNLRMMDKVVVMFTSPDLDLSIACADRFEELLMESDGSPHIASIISGVGSGDITETIDHIYGNLPVYLTDADYRRLDSLLSTDGVERAVADSYTRLTSPLGMAVRDMILRDPLGIATGRLAVIERFSSMAAYEVYDGHIFSLDMSTMLIVIQPRQGIGDTGANEVLVSAIERSAVETTSEEGFGGVQIEYIGGPSMAVYNARQVKADTWLTLSIALLVTVVFILATFRNRLSVLLILTPVIFGGLFALSTIWLLGQHTMSSIAVGAGAAVLGVALSYSIHVISHANHTSDPRRIIRELAYPLTVGSFTTIGAFLGLLFTKSGLLRDFGLFAALTLVGTTLFCLIFLPQFLSGRGRKNSVGGVGRLVNHIGAYPYDRKRALIWTLIAVTAVCLFFYGRVGFDSDMMNLNYTPPHLKAAEDRLALFTADAERPVLFISIGGDLEEAFASYRTTGATLDSLRSTGLVDGFVTAADFLPPPSLQRERIERWNDFWDDSRREQTIDRIEASATTSGFRPGVFDSFTDNLSKDLSPTDILTDGLPSFLTDWVSVASDGTLMLVSSVRLSAENKEAVYARFATEPDVVIVDRGWFASRMARGIGDDFNLVLMIASTLIFIALLMAYGRIELTLMAFMPMLVSWIIILGLMALLGIDFNIVSIILSTFIFGIGDDFSIFIMDGLLAEYRGGKKMLAAHKTAIFFSAFTIIVGLGVMILARHPAMQSLAMVSILGILSVIVVAYVLQPVVFRIFISSQTRRGGFPYTIVGLANSVYAFAYFLVGCVVLWFIIALLWVLPVSRWRKKLWFHHSVRCSTWFFLRTMFTTRCVAINESGETFAKPAVIIANHTSFIDILVLLSLHSKLVMVTNSWVWRSPFFGWIVRYADFYHTADGYDRLAESLREKVADGYSVVVFPEGTRSPDLKIKRFHKGAFHLAEKLRLDILPIVLYGNGLASSKRQPFYVKKSLLVSSILPRISSTDPRFGTTISERTKRIGEHFRREYTAVYEEFNRTRNPYFFDALIKSYTYKGPILEWYMRIKVRMERSYDFFDRLVPRDASVVDIGCGYGPLAYMLALLSDRRRVLGIDYDEEKIAVACHSFLHSDRTRFEAADALEYDLPQADVFILNDVLHYMPFDRQDALLARCFAKVIPGGMVIIRDGDASESERHRATERTERWSTRLLKFNKTIGELHFTDSARITTAARCAGFEVKILYNAVKTSNKIYICTMS
ncbi:MAG: 1-acyl-sn-glycerol-3-phosphate acyltransferase [Alistipes sp.]|jgi:1-acyl-sn-glycerol-3-phosphate acyltransferase|nr:1-acyl-sn-glycerol-3-phosphate acyltransferase [Alistipes sp.]